jgi:SAM-dependent methyltransferase
LDIGCGTGDVVAVLRSKGYSVVGIDVSNAVARDTARRFAGDPQVSIRPSSLAEVSGAFDLITSVTVMQHVPDAELLEALRRLHAPTLVALEIAPVDRFGESGQGVIERTASEWRALFLRAGWSVSAERTFAPWGPVLVIRLNRLVNRAFAGRTASSAALALSAQSNAVETATLKRRILRWGYRAARGFLLWLGRPLDALGLQAPWAYYRIFVLTRATRGAG